MRKFKEKLLLYLAPLLTSIIIRFIKMTSKAITINEVDLNKEQIILAFWHGRMLMIPFLKKGRPASVMISRHKDGELISRTMQRFGIGSSRGSSTRGGMSALKDMLRLAAKGTSLVFTPDGPKGPKYIAQIGAIQAAKATGLSIYPVTYGARKKKLLVPGMVL
jgi:hypothetical protein